MLAQRVVCQGMLGKRIHGRDEDGEAVSDGCPPGGQQEHLDGPAAVPPAEIRLDNLLFLAHALLNEAKQSKGSGVDLGPVWGDEYLSEAFHGQHASVFLGQLVHIHGRVCQRHGIRIGFAVGRAHRRNARPSP